MQSTPESGGRAGYDGYKRRKGSKVHMAVDTLGHLLALHVTPADEQDRDQVAVLAEAVQEVTGESVELAFVDQGYTGDDAAADAAELRDPPGGREAARGEAGVRAAAAALGRGAVVRLDGAVPPAGAGLRAAQRDPGGAALRRLQHPDASQGRPAVPLEFITRSNRHGPNRREEPWGRPRDWKSREGLSWLPVWQHDRLSSPDDARKCGG